MQIILVRLKLFFFLFVIFNVSIAIADCNTDTKYFFVNGVGKVDETQVAIDMRVLNETLLRKQLIGTKPVTALFNPSDGVLFDVLGELTAQITTTRNANFADTFLNVGLTAWGYMTTLAESDKTQIRSRLSYLISQASLGYTSLYDGKQITTADLVNNFKDKITVELANGSKVVLVAHSQGNFFANDTYTAVVANLPAAQSQGLAVANIANPTPNAASGLYATITQDLVIQAARVQSAALLAQQPLFANLDAPGASSIDESDTNNNAPKHGE